MEKIILFDLDGVLVDACDWHYESLNNSLIKNNYLPITREDHIKTFNGLPTKVKLKMLNILPEDIAKISNEKQKNTIDVIKKYGKIMPEKIELLKYLKFNNFKIGCVTNSIEETAKLMLQVTGQIDFIDLLVTNENVKKNKPNPDCYLYAMEKMCSIPEKVYCVEDSSIGIEAARRANIKNIFIVSNTEQVNVANITKFLSREQ
jgi:HAD superfamily hydrolase (TIGR01549 family)